MLQEKLLEEGYLRHEKNLRRSNKCKFTLPTLKFKKYMSKQVKINMEEVILPTRLVNVIDVGIYCPYEFKNIVQIEIFNIKTEDRRVMQILQWLNPCNIKIIKMISYRHDTEAIFDPKKWTVNIK